MLPASLPRLVPCHLATSFDSNRSFILSRPRLIVSDKLSDSFYYDLDPPDDSDSSPSDTHTLDDDFLPSPPAQARTPPNYHYEALSFGSSSESPTEMYCDPPSGYITSNIYNLPPRSAPSDYSIGTVTDIRESDPPPSDPPAASYPSDSPSPGDVHPSAAIFYSPSDPHSQDRFPSFSTSSADPDHNLSHSQLLPERDPTNNTSLAPSSSSPISLPQTHSSTLDRHMSEPAVLVSPNPYSANSQSPSSTSRYPMPYNSTSRSAYVPSLHRGSSIGSLRELRQLEESRTTPSFHTGDVLNSPLSPFQPGFPGGSPLVQYSISEDQYGTSPSETGFPSPGPEANVVPQITDRQGRSRSSTDPSNKTYSFVALPGNAVKKRPRRRYDEIERLYQCSWPDCNKSYGTLNHLNAHVTMQKHGPKRSPNEFKELRKQWRKAKKEAEVAANVARRSSMGSILSDEHEFYDTHHYSSPQQRFPFPGPHSLSSPVPISSRYGVSSGVEEFYTTGDRTERGVDYSSISARPRYGETSGSVPWNHSSISSTRFISSSLPAQSSAHSYHYGGHGLHSLEAPPFQSGGSCDRPLSIPSPPQMMTGRLPPNSTLLTPLPGYEPRETLPPLQMGGDMTYEPGAYYDEDSRRSGSGHASAGRARGDDF